MAKSLDEVKRENIEKMMKTFAQASRREMINLTTNTSSTTTLSFTEYTKEQISNALLSPNLDANIKILRNASIQAFQNSTQYRRLIQYYALQLLWTYLIVPDSLDTKKVNLDAVRKQYLKVTQEVSNMNIPHEMSKAMITTLKEGVLYGIIWRSTNSWFIQKIDPDICSLTSIEDGTWMYGIDMSKIKEKDLFKYPPEITSMRNTYLSTGIKIQEVPSNISFCLKADESVDYPIPPWASVMEDLFDLNNAKELSTVGNKLENYKLLNMEIPLADDGTPLFDWNLAMEYYEQLCNSLPEYIGATVMPMELKAINFEKSGIGKSVGEVTEATRNFWYGNGTSPLLFGDCVNDSSSALVLSIQTDSDIILNIMTQCERLLNRHIRTVSGSIKFKITFLPITRFNLDKYIGYYKEAATLGAPTKMAYCAAVGVKANDIESMSYLENEVLGINDMFVPLQTSYTQSGDTGRPEIDETKLTESGQKTKDNDSNANNK